MTQGTYWIFTLNSNPQSFSDRLGEIYQDNKTHIKYICGQIEVAPSTGQRHFQGYVQLHRSQRLSWVRNNISDQAHWEKQRGTNVQARNYTMKEETAEPESFREFGKFVKGRSNGPGEPGRRNDIHGLRDAVKEGRNQRSIIEDDELVESFAKYIKFADRVRMLYPPKPREEGVEVHLYYGDPGTGKTRKAVEENPDLFEIPISNGTMWMDGYDDQDTVLFDDYIGAGSKMTLDNTLKYLDRYVRKVPIKGSHVWWRPRKIIVTTNYHPRAWYKWESREESYKALARRFHHVLTFRTGQEPVEEDPEEFFFDRELWPVQESTDENYGADGRRH